MRSRSCLLCLTAALVGSALEVSTADAQVSYPMVMDAAPLAVQVGKTSEIEISARFTFYGAFQAMVSGAGVEAEVIAPPEQKVEPTQVAAVDAKSAKDQTGKDKPAEAKSTDPKTPAKSEKKKDVPAPMSDRPAIPKLKLRVKVADDALLGVRDLRIATAQGVSTLGQIAIVRDPVQLEKNPNDVMKEATLISLPGTACGVIEKPEDVDFFKFTIEKPTTLTFHVRSARCQDRIHDLQAHSDPLIAVRNSSGTVLAMSDNYFFADPLLSYEFKNPGEYYLEMRDVRYLGNTYWQYSVEINARPFVTNVFPLAVPAGKSSGVELIGFNLPQPAQASITAGSITSGAIDGGELQWSDVKLAGGSTNPAPILVTKLPIVGESSNHQTRETAQVVAVPSCINGRITAANEVDYFAFDAKKGETFTIDVVARRHQSALDPIVGLLNEKGARITENDDFTFGRRATGDSCLENFVAPNDGRYTIEIRDLHLEGGPAFVYAIQVTRTEPQFRLWLDSDKTVLGPGSSAALYVRVGRKIRFTGDIALHIDGLPTGVTAVCGKILDGLNDGCIVLTAADNAQLCAKHVTIRGTAKLDVDGQPREFNVSAEPYQETYFPGGGRGLYDVDWHTVSVGGPLDIRRVQLSATDVVLKPGESKKIDITIERAPGFDKNVSLDVMYRHLGNISGNSLPAGITLDEKNSKTLLTGSATQGYITLTAAKEAKPVQEQIIPVMAHVSINFVMKMSYASQPLKVSIQP